MTKNQIFPNHPKWPKMAKKPPKSPKSAQKTQNYRIKPYFTVYDSSGTSHIYVYQSKSKQNMGKSNFGDAKSLSIKYFCYNHTFNT